MSFERRLDLLALDFAEQKRLVRQLLTQAPIGYSSVSQGALRIASNEGLLVQGSAKVEGWLVVTGTERVTGTLEVQGRLIASGAIDLSGPTTITGATSITGDTDISGRLRASGAIELNGPTKITGETEITGNTKITGDTTLTGNLEVRDDGKITVGEMVIDPAGGGQVTFPGGARVRGGGSGGVEVRQGDYSAVVTSAGASIGRPGRSISVTEAGIQLLGVPTGSPGPEYQAGVYYRDPTGMTRVASGT